MADQITPQDVADDAVILDVREQDEWDAGHAPGAVHIPLGDLPQRIDDIPQTDETLPVICRRGGRSAQAVAWLEQQGFDVVNVDGGMSQWAADGKVIVADSGDPKII